MQRVLHKHVEKIAFLNDHFRQSLVGGKVILSKKVRALARADQKQLLNSVRCFNTFGGENDPYGEHDFGCIWVKGQRFFFQISCYNLELKKRSIEPHMPSETKRVMVILRQDEIQTTSSMGD